MNITRRSLVKSATAVSVASLLGQHMVFATVAERKVRVGIVGGRFGATFQFHDHPNCIVEAVSDLRTDRRQRLMKTYRCEKSYESLEQLLTDPKIEAVVIMTPAPDHVAHVELALKAGKHVLCAVPAASGSLEECERLLEIVRTSGLIYMLAETSYYQQATISARRFYEQGAFGNIFFAESEYHHPGLEELFFEDGQRTWRYGYAPMHYPTHCTAHLISVSGERLTEVSCIGYTDDSPILKDNPYNNPFWNETAMFKTDRGNAFRVAVWWRGAAKGTERAQLYGERMSFFWPHPHGLGPVVVRASTRTEADSGGFVRWRTSHEAYDQPLWWQTEMLPEPLRHDSGHEGSHTFLTHEFIDAIVNERRAAIDVYEALAYTAPGIVAHESALKDGERLPIPQYDPKKHDSGQS
jgi:predicted dehydrogenase